MGLFGGAAKTKTEVKPDKRVANILKDIVSTTQNMDVGKYIPHEIAGLNDTEKAALSQLISSPALKQAAQNYMPQTATGLSQLQGANERLNQVATSPVGAASIKDFGRAITGGAPATLSSQQGIRAGGALGALGGGAAARLQNRQNTQDIGAMQNLQRQQQANALGVNSLLGNQANIGNLAQMQSGLGRTNVGLGMQGTNAYQQAIQNQLNAGNIQQQQAQNELTNAWQNQIGQQQFDWNQLNNKLNILNQVSPMAGATTNSTSANISKGQQLLGAGVTGLGLYGSLGGFTGAGNTNQQGQATNQWYNNQGTGMINQLGNGWNSLTNYFGG